MRRLLITLIGVCALVTPLGASTASADDSVSDMRFVSYNVKNNYQRIDGERVAFAPSDPRYWERREAGVVELLAKANVPVIALQETETYTDADGDEQNPAERIRDALQDQGETYELATAGDSPRAVLYDTSVLSADGTGAVSGPAGTHPARWVRLTDTTRDVSFYVANMHLSVSADGHPSDDATSENQRTAEAQAVYDTMQDVNTTGDRVVYIGDFNTYAGRHVDGAEGDGAGTYLWDQGAIETGDQRQGYRTCYRHCTNFAYDTYNDFEPADEHRNARHIDRMFVSDEWSDTLEWKLLFVDQGISDHFPIKVWMMY